ncbi:TPA: hypothetical protein HA241_01780 [Candidatus Woesearchaeota archaeon]|nr:hypothetical protein [Candidatus Woesearchaeota archaeon]
MLGEELIVEPPLSRQIYGTKLLVYECFETYLAVVRAVSGRHLFYYQESLKPDLYQLVSGFLTNDFQVYLRLPGEFVSEEECRVQFSQLERIVRAKGVELVNGRVEVTAQL